VVAVVVEAFSIPQVLQYQEVLHTQLLLAVVVLEASQVVFQGQMEAILLLQA
jgi:hypothetical protein